MSSEASINVDNSTVEHSMDSTPAAAAATYTPEVFNRALLDFIRDLATSFPHVEGFRRAFAMTNLMATMNPPMVQGIFSRCVMPYAPRILAHDESFFLQKDYQSELSGFVGGEAQIELVSELKKIWSGLDEEDKATVWKHMDLLIALNHAFESSKSL
jgi:hypothetical protein